MASLHVFDSKTTRWISVLRAPILSLVAFVLAYWFDPLKFGRHPLAALPAFFLATIILMIGQAITTVQELQKTSTYSDRIYDAIKDYLHITPIGSPEEAFRYIDGRIPILREVMNTSFNLDDETERANEKFYDTDIYRRMGQQIAYYCSRNLLWKDIGDSFAVSRFRSIRDGSEKIQNDKRGGYRYKLITHNEPQINFILLEYKDGAREVLFNWDFRGVGQDPTVLISRDKHILDMFSIQFAMLWRRASEDHDNHATKSISKK